MTQRESYYKKLARFLEQKNKTKALEEQARRARGLANQKAYNKDRPGLYRLHQAGLQFRKGV